MGEARKNGRLGVLGVFARVRFKKGIEMRMIIMVTVGFLSAFGLNTFAEDDHADHQTAVSTQTVQKVQTTCPIMDGKINKKFFAD